DVDGFVNGKSTQITNDATNLYRKLGGQHAIPNGSVSEILGALKHRIKEAMGEHFIPAVTFTDIRFNTAEGGKFSEPWARGGFKHACLKSADDPGGTMTLATSVVADKKR